MKLATTSCLSSEQAGALSERWGGRCAYCGVRVYRRMAFDHVEPLSRGGADVPDNLVPACPSCNASKSNMLLLEWVFAAYGLVAMTRSHGVQTVSQKKSRRAPHWIAAPERSVVAVERHQVVLSCGHRVSLGFVPRHLHPNGTAFVVEAPMTGDARRCLDCISPSCRDGAER